MNKTKFFLILITCFSIITSCKDSRIDLNDEKSIEVLDKCNFKLSLDKKIPIIKKAKIRYESFKECLKENKYDFSTSLKNISNEKYNKSDKEKIYNFLGSYFYSLKEDPNLELKDFTSVFSNEEIKFVETIQSKMEQEGDFYPAISLKRKLYDYKRNFDSRDFVSLTSFILPSILKDSGGAEVFIEDMKKFISIEEKGAKLEEMLIGKIGKIETYNNYSFSITPIKIFFKGLNDKANMEIKISLVAISENKGETWFFFLGEDSHKLSLSKIAPDLVSKMIIPQGVMEVGFGNKKAILIEKNGQYVEVENNIRELPNLFINQYVGHKLYMNSPNGSKLIEVIRD